MIVTISVIKHAFLVPKYSNRDLCSSDPKRGKYLITYSFFWERVVSVSDVRIGGLRKAEACSGIGHPRMDV